MASPWLLKSGAPLKKPADLAQFALIEAGDAHQTHLEWLTWRRWFDEHGFPKLQPKRWLYFNYAYQMVQAALTGQGVVLARLPMVAESLANGDLVEPLPHQRMDSPMAYWLIVGPRSAQRPEIKAFCEWLMAQSKATRADHRRSAGPGHHRRHRLGRTAFACGPAGIHCGTYPIEPDALASAIGQTTPLSFRIASSGTSCGSGSKSSRKPLVKPRPTV